MIPLEGRGIDRLDVRVYPIDPLNRSLWPFPNTPIVLQEDELPFAPGEAPYPFKDPRRHIYVHELQKQIKALGSPIVSTLTGIPLDKKGGAATLGFDVKPLFEQIKGPGAPGTYLVGLRKLGPSDERHYVRVQVTDLCLTTIEEAQQIQFIVTSLRTGKAVPYAKIIVEGMQTFQNTRKWITMVQGQTNAQGRFALGAPGQNNWQKRDDVRRLIVIKDQDVLVLDPSTPPDYFQNNVWYSSYDVWCQWAFDHSSRYDYDNERLIGHIFPERPVYKPGEPVHLKGFVRMSKQGELSLINGKGALVVTGPGNLKWRYPMTINPFGSFYHQFKEKNLPTGEYTVHYQDDTYGRISGSTSFKIEAYRLPKFEVLLNGPDATDLDAPFSIGLTAKYYDGGRVTQQPLSWRVTQFPYNWTPVKQEGFVYATDARFSKIRRFRSTPAKEKQSTTDDLGSARIEIDPTQEPTAQPRRYIVEAIVTGSDDQTVSATHAVLALPPFTLGLKIPRYIRNASSLDPKIIVVGQKGELIAGQALNIQVLQRQWHSRLQANDFSTGAAKYVTDVVDHSIYSTRLVSQANPVTLKIPIDRSGVYIVEIDAQDKMGRTQSVAVDLFAGGDEPVTWRQPPSSVFKVTPAKNNYRPGETATLLLESPFQRARVLAVLEQPDGKNTYDWIPVENGAATFEFEIEKQYMPRIPVHFLLMRGRLASETPLPLTGLDLGKPKTLAATAWVEVIPVKNQIHIDLKAPAKAQPGDEIKITLKLTDDKGQPVSGEATLWLVDQAVLALGTEHHLDPVPDFIVSRTSYFMARGTRNLIFGHFPLQEIPGGAAAMKKAESDLEDQLLDKVTVRKNFMPVPYYNPSIIVGHEGVATVQVKLPDNLTNFKLRAKAVSGPDRFGYGKGHLAVRLPLIVQPSLPRFVRPGDQFTAIAIGRVVDGQGGPGQTQIKVQGLILEGPAQKPLILNPRQPQRIEFQLKVPTPETVADVAAPRKSVRITLGVSRTKDGSKDAFSVNLPLKDDRQTIRQRLIKELTVQTPVTLAGVTEPIRPGTFNRSILISRYPGILRMAAGLNYLTEYPHGCTEQRISRARARLGAKRFRDLLGPQETPTLLDRDIDQTLKWLASVKSQQNLAAYWPGSAGNISLTAWVVMFMLEAREAGYPIDAQLLDDFLTALTQSLRSDYNDLIHGESYAERCWALTALSAAGKLDAGYASELARRADYLNLESLALVTQALIRGEGADNAQVKALKKRLWDGLVIRLYHGQKQYGGLQSPITSSALILPSETRTLAEVLRAVAVGGADDPSKDLLVNALLTLGQNDGWGSTNANSAAILALVDYMRHPNEQKSAVSMRLTTGHQTTDVILEKNQSFKQIADSDASNAGEPLKLEIGEDVSHPLMVSVETAYLPLADGSLVRAHSQGFVVQRELLKIIKEDLPPERIQLDAPGKTLQFQVGTVIEEHLQVVNPKDRHYVAVVVPIACGMEPLNPNLATAPPAARATGQLTATPTHVAFMDDAMAFYYTTLPKGTYHFYFRTQAAIPGIYIQPSAYAEMMYHLAVNGNSNGAKIIIQKPPEK